MRKGDRLTLGLSAPTVFLLGFLANALALLTFMALFYLCLTVSSLFFTIVDRLARARSAGPALGSGYALRLAGASIAGSVRNALLGLWSARLGFLLFGALGALAAWADEIGLLLLKKDRAWLGSFICMAAIIAVSIITWACAQREEVALWMAGAPETYRWRDVLLRSYAVDVSVALIFGLAITYPVWVVWRWWYSRLGTRLLGPTPREEATPPLPSAAQEAYGSYAARLLALKRQGLPGESHPSEARRGEAGAALPATLTPIGEILQRGTLIKPLAISFVACAALLFPVNSYHNRVAVRLQHGTAFVDTASQPEQALPVRVEPGIRRIRVVNINGIGAVGIYLSPTADYRQAVESVRGWSFEWRSSEYLYVDVPAGNLQPGDYYLHFVQESGWGYFEYMLSHGGGTSSHLSALATGLLLASCLILGVALVTAGAARLVRSTTTPAL